MLKMKRYAWVLSVLVGLFVVAGPLQAQEEPAGQKVRKAKKTKQAKPAKKQSRTRLRGTFAQMAKELTLSQTQTAELEKISADQAEAVKAWQRENKDKADQLNEQWKQARQDKDREKISELTKQRAQIKAEKDKVSQPFEQRVQALLTPEQKQKWQGFLLFQKVSGKLRRCKLTEEQQTKIKQMAQDVTASTKDSAEAEKQLATQALTVLTEEQKSKMQPAEKAKGPKQPKADKPKQGGKGRKKPAHDDFDEDGEDVDEYEG
jgi:Spy/CpxP family protein refolding chaperone